MKRIRSEAEIGHPLWILDRQILAEFMPALVSPHAVNPFHVTGCRGIIRWQWGLVAIILIIKPAAGVGLDRGPRQDPQRAELFLT